MEKLTFNSIDKAFHGQLSLIIKIACDDVMRENFDRGYERAKRLLSNFVGWYACHDVKELKTREAYKIVMDKLADECWVVVDEKEARLKARDAKYADLNDEEKKIAIMKDCCRHLGDPEKPAERKKRLQDERAYSQIIKLGLAKN